ncbi:TonB-dependent receptor [bacterium]|nr:TonB-dependent receptor [bacterium]
MRNYSQWHWQMLVFFLWISVPILAQTGRIAGRISSAVNNEPLPGTNVIIRGSLLGAATDLGGEYYIDGVPAGAVTLEALNIGFQPKRKTILVSPGETVQVDFQLQPKVHKSPEIVVTGARRTSRKMDSPVTIATISEDQIRLRNPVTIADVLPYESGVQIIDGQLNIRGSSGYARGAGSRVQILVDGFPAIAFDNGAIYWDAIPAQDVERIEILKGPGSALYGSSAMGGVVNIITRQITSNRKSDVTLGGGIYAKPGDERQAWTDRSMLQEDWRVQHEQRFGRLGFTLGIGQSNSSGYRQNGWYRRTLLNARLEYALPDNRSLMSRILYIDDIHGSFTQWRSPIQPFHTPPNTVDDQVLTNKLQWSTLYNRIVSARHSRQLRLNVFRTSFDNDMASNTGAAMSQTLSGEVQLDYRPGESHYLTAGLDASINQVQADIWGDHRGTDLALFLQDEMNVSALIGLTSGLRWDIHRIDDASIQSKVNPKFGLILKLHEQLTLRGSLGWAFRAPVAAEMFIETQQYLFRVKPNPDLQSETSIASEVGIYWQTYFLTLDAALFSSHYEQLIEPVLDPDDQRIQFRNITEAVIQGAEITVDWKWPLIPASSRVSYTYIDPRDLTADDLLAYRHPHSLMISEQLIFSDRLSLGIDYRYLSKMERVQLFPENSRTGADQRVPIHLVGGFCNISLQKSLTLNLSVENLFQYRYVMVERNMGPVRLVKLRMNYVF